jgi:hypothetical protein
MGTSIDRPYDDLFGEHLWRDKNLQRRGCEREQESLWAAVVGADANITSMYDTIRFIEGSGVLARQWMNVLPTERAFTLTNEQVRYNLRVALLSQFHELQAPSGVCPDCAGTRRDHPMHHLLCDKTGAIRTNRHTSLKFITKYQMERAGCENVVMEQVTGTQTRDGTQGKSDIRVTIRDVDNHYDLTVAKADYARKDVKWPSDEDIEVEIELDRRLGQAARRPVIFFWEDHSDEKPHPRVVQYRKFRQLMVQATVGKDLAAADAEKTNKYGNYMVPLSFTPLGCMGRKTRDLVDNLLHHSDKMDLGEKAAWRKHLYGRWSCALMRSAHIMATIRAGRRGGGY